MKSLKKKDGRLLVLIFFPSIEICLLIESVWLWFCLFNILYLCHNCHICHIQGDSSSTANAIDLYTVCLALDLGIRY